MNQPSVEVTYTTSKDLVKLPVNKHTAVYHRKLGGLSLLNEESLRTLMSFEKGKTLKTNLFTSEANDRNDELIQQLALRKLIIPENLSFPTNQETQVGNTNLVTVIQLVMANACNFGCTYCFEGVQGQELSVDNHMNSLDESRIIARDSIKIDINDSMYASEERFAHQYDPKNRHMKDKAGVSYVKDALKAVKASGSSNVMIQFFGGEPLLNWKTINKVLNTFGHEHDGIDIQYSTVTNGSLITEEVAETFANFNVAVCVSVDSPTSPSRPLKNGDHSMPIVMDGLRKLQKYQNRVALNSALTSSTWNDFDRSIVDLAVDVGASEIGVVVDFDPTFYTKFGTENIVDKLWNVIQYGRQKGVILTGYWHQIFQVMLGFDAVSYRGFKNCSAKGAQLSIEPNGSVFSCKAGSTLMGNIHEATNLLESDSYQSHNKLRRNNPSICNRCEIEGFCAGLCLGTLEKKFNSIGAVEPATCNFYREITKKHIQSLQPDELATFDL